MDLNLDSYLQALEEESKRRAAEAAAAAADKRAQDEIMRICSEHRAQVKTQLETDIQQARQEERAKCQATFEVSHLEKGAMLRHPSCKPVFDFTFVWPSC